ncbi:keratin, type I cytoskeletal 13-like isoform X2 [Electrophorus electricus]|uniref:keratin, type I cytoskeletal 13-like isoform X2 n=1 Tax=Electrophorus electricus TaxID=8005 RepID=UPI0015D0BDDD|nr:keratin, type I cytoskeletal 13-like isoform X2 [Electrophorus electricus]
MSNFSSSRLNSSISLSGGYSTRASSVRASSIYGGADGSGVRVSQAGWLKQGFDLNETFDNGFNVSQNEKATMQNLNDRLATYLNKVRSLEKANAELERQIREWSDKKTVGRRDYSPYFATIAELRQKIHIASLENARVILNIDNAKLAAEDFRVKYENELTMRQSVESDVARLRRVLDDLTMLRSDLEIRIEGLKEEVVYLKKNHEEELAAIRSNTGSSSVNVDVDAPPQQDLGHMLNEIRTQYEGIVEKNRRDMESWYKAKFDEVNQQVKENTQVIQTSHSEISELRKTLQALEIELQSQLSLKAALEGTLHDAESRYSLKLSQLQGMINNLQIEITQIRTDIERQDSEYRMLLDIKTRLEMEIAEYRRLLEGEDSYGKTTVTKVVESKLLMIVPLPTPSDEPVITKRVRTVIEEMVDGKVVSRTEDVDMEVLKK